MKKLAAAGNTAAAKRRALVWILFSYILFLLSSRMSIFQAHKFAFSHNYIACPQDLVRVRQAKERLYKLCGNVSSVKTRNTVAASQAAMMSSMAASTKAMATMNAVMPVQQMQRVAAEHQKQSMLMDTKQEFSFFLSFFLFFFFFFFCVCVCVCVCVFVCA